MDGVVWNTISAGAEHTCAIGSSAADGPDKPYCWGSATYGRVSEVMRGLEGG